MPRDPDWHKRHRLIAEKIAELAKVLMQQITAAQDEVPASDSAEFPSFCLVQENAARKWVETMVAASVEQLGAEAPSVWEHPADLWRFLPAASNGEIATTIQVLLHASFRVTRRDIELIKECNGYDKSKFMRSNGEGVWVFKTASIERAWENARNKTSAVDEIIENLLGPKGELAFGTEADRKFEVPAAATSNAATSPGVPRRNKGGRPRKDVERAKVQRLRDEGKSWGQVKKILNQELAKNI